MKKIDKGFTEDKKKAGVNYAQGKTRNNKSNADNKKRKRETIKENVKTGKVARIEKTTKPVNNKKDKSNNVRLKPENAFHETNKPVKEKKGAKKDKAVLKVRFLGGVGEIGKNMTVLEYGKDIIVIDAGTIFPGDNMPGVDLVIPDVSYLIQNKDRVRGIVITHGHEDHIGALPYILKDLNVPVYGTKLTLTLIENKLREFKINDAVLNCVKPDSKVKLGCFVVDFINVNHSIAGAVALSITTPVGVVFHTGDFKIDYTPVSGAPIDLAGIAEIGEKGVLLLMADSTNIEIDGTTMSEKVVKDTFEHVFSDNVNRRLIIATFASNVHRLQQILDLAEKYGRKVAFSGRSMINIAEAASKIGELRIPEKLIIDVEQIKNYKDGQVVIVSTGTQGEPMSALTRMAVGEFNKVKIGENDTVVISASVIPGNEKMIYGVINNLYRLGAEVIYESLEPIHVSGHACSGELKIIHNLLKPKFFVPVHGEYRHLKKHVQLAERLGMKQGTTMIAEIGDTIELTRDTIRRGEKFPAGSKLVDGVGIDGSDSFVLRDRIHLSEDGLIVVVVGVEEASARLNSVEIVGKGLAINEEMIAEARAILKNTINQTDLRALHDENELSAIIRRSLKNYVFRVTGKNPMILPIVMVV